jgi:hypothetical protein
MEGVAPLMYEVKGSSGRTARMRSGKISLPTLLAAALYAMDGCCSPITGMLKDGAGSPGMY